MQNFKNLGSHTLIKIFSDHILTIPLKFVGTNSSSLNKVLCFKHLLDLNSNADLIWNSYIQFIDIETGKKDWFILPLWQLLPGFIFTRVRLEKKEIKCVSLPYLDCSCPTLIMFKIIYVVLQGIPPPDPMLQTIATFTLFIPKLHSLVYFRYLQLKPAIPHPQS